MSNVKLIKREYTASGGKEIFLSYEDIKQNKLIAFLRLRLSQIYKIPQKNIRDIREKLEIIRALRDSAIIREVHTYGTMIPIGQSGKVQHRGFGKKLLAEAEKITRQTGYERLAVISGIGVRDYYRKLGYNLKDEYMIKNITRSF